MANDWKDKTDEVTLRMLADGMPPLEDLAKRAGYDDVPQMLHQALDNGMTILVQCLAECEDDETDVEDMTEH